jgi:DNA-binding winged helix-turn-helix (wHTH) protein
VASGEGTTYRFAAYRLDPAERLLFRNGQLVPLTPKAFDLLVYLVEHHGRLVEKSTLMAVLWPDTIVEEANLAFQVSVLRKALEDRGNGETLIQTVPTKGYRFVAPVTTITSASTVATSTVDTVAAAPRCETGTIERGLGKTGRTVTIAAGSLELLAAFVAAVVAPRRPAAEGHPERPAPAPVLTQLTANPSEQGVTTARISLDGRMLAFTDAAGIHLQFIDSGETELLADTRSMRIYAWTSDSTKVRAASCTAETCVGWDISIVGGKRNASGAKWPANTP